MASFDAHTTLNSEQLGAVLGLTGRRVQQLETESIFPNVGNGRNKRFILSESVQSFVEFVKKSEIARLEATQDPDKLSFEAERTRKLRLENDLKENLLVETPDAIAAVDVIVGMLRTDLSAIPARVSDDVALRRLVENEIDAVLGALSRRFAKAASDLQSGRDPLAADDETTG
jgi:phage terminase Nu1 subunit (DNA packaging protein)